MVQAKGLEEKGSPHSMPFTGLECTPLRCLPSKPLLFQSPKLRVTTPVIVVPPCTHVHKWDFFAL